MSPSWAAAWSAAPALGLAQQGFTVTVLESGATGVRSGIRPGCADLGDQRGFGRPAEESRRLGCHTGDARPRLSPSGDWESAHVAFDAAELKLPELGYMVENKVLQWGLWQALAAHEAVTLRVGSELKTMQRGETRRRCICARGDDPRPAGYRRRRRYSRVREMAGIGVHAAISAVLYADQRRMRRRSRRQHGSSLLPAARAPSCRCSTTGPRWSGTTPRRGSVSCKA